MTVMHAFLAIEQAPADVIGYPDGRIDVVPAGEGTEIANAWAADDQDRDGLEARHQQPRAVRELNEAEVTRIHQERAEAWERDMKQELERLERSPAAALGSAEGRRQAYLIRNPAPTLDHVREELRKPQPSGTQDNAGPVATVDQEDGHWWARSAGLAPDTCRLLAPPGPVPRKEVAAMLSELADAGWEVVHVSEDRAVLHESDRSVTTCVGLNMLIRETPPSR